MVCMCFAFTDSLMYQCLLKNELLGSEIERIKDCHSEDRRITGSPCSEKKNLFKVIETY